MTNTTSSNTKMHLVKYVNQLDNEVYQIWYGSLNEYSNKRLKELNATVREMTVEEMLKVEAGDFDLSKGS